MTKKKKGITVLFFLVCLGLGYGITKWIKDSPAEPAEPIHVDVNPTPPEPVPDSIVEPDSTGPQENEENKPEPVITTVNKTVIKRPKTDLPTPDVPASEPAKERMTKEAFHSMLVDQNDNVLVGQGNEQVAANVDIIVENLDSDEPKINGAVDLRWRMTHDSKWEEKGVEITRLGYDNEGKVNHAVVRRK